MDEGQKTFKSELMIHDRIIAFGYAMLTIEDIQRVSDALPEKSHQIYFPELLQEFLDFNPPLKPYGKDWDYELDKVKAELHQKIDRMYNPFIDRCMLLFHETGNMIYTRPPSKFITGIDPIDHFKT